MNAMGPLSAVFISYRWSLPACLVLAAVATLGLTNAASSSGEHLSDPPARATVSAAEQNFGAALQPTPFPAGSPNDRPRTIAEVISLLPLSPLAYFDIPEELAKLPVEGDWVAAENAEPQAILDTLSKIVREQYGRDVHFEQEPVRRDVIVMSGDYKFAGLPQAKDPKALLICTDYPAQWRMSRRVLTDLNDLKRAIEDALVMPVVNEGRGGPADRLQAELFRVFTSPYDERSMRIAECTSVLEMVTKQTGLTFRIEPRTVLIWVMKEGSGATKLEPPASVTVSIAQEQNELGPQVKADATTQPGTAGNDQEAPVETRYYEFRHLDKDDCPAIERYIAEQLPESPRQHFEFHDDHNQGVLTDTTDNLAQFERWLAEVDVASSHYTAELRVMTIKKEEAASVLCGYCDINSSKPILFTIAWQDVEKLTEDLDKLPSAELIGVPRVTFKARPPLLKAFRPNASLLQCAQTYSISFVDWIQKNGPVDAVIHCCTTEFIASASGTPAPRMLGMLAGYNVMPVTNSEDCSVNFYFNMTGLVKKGRGLAFWKPRPLPTIREAPLDVQLRYTRAKPFATVVVRDTQEADCVEMLLLTLTQVEATG